ncbi:DUF4417 domain-containing protein [Leptolyngbya sp. AN02str]|uniref:DUF4417 domain-containing protein n=1 Tax=Leptolyngbya sp. AN02str TaxID=3423363 RepID=UPI003D311E44
MTRRRMIDGSWTARIARNHYNLNTFCFMWGIRFVGEFGMPELRPCDAVPESIFPYDERNKWKPEDGAIHFYCEDCEFENVWLRANRYPHMPAVVQKAGVVLTPDFSLFTDFPVATQIWNVYRSRLLGAIWQHQGLQVIPSVVWGDRASFAWCFDGLPVGGTLAVSTGHVAKHEQAGFMAGFEVMLERCQPDTVLVYGRGMKGQLEAIANVRRYDSRLTQIYEARKRKTA